mgnify:CR=1 FL=1
MEKKELKDVINDFLKLVEEVPDGANISNEFYIDGINICEFLKIAVDKLKREWIYVSF